MMRMPDVWASAMIEIESQSSLPELLQSWDIRCGMMRYSKHMLVIPISKDAEGASAALLSSRRWWIRSSSGAYPDQASPLALQLIFLRL